MFNATEWWCAKQTLTRDAFVELLVGYVWAGFTASGIEASDEPVDLSAVSTAIATAIEASQPG